MDSFPEALQCVMAWLLKKKTKPKKHNVTFLHNNKHVKMLKVLRCLFGKHQDHDYVLFDICKRLQREP